MRRAARAVCRTSGRAAGPDRAWSVGSPWARDEVMRRGLGEPAGDEDGEGGEGGEDVVFLAGGEGEEEEDEGGPEEEEKGAAALEGEIVVAELAAEGLGAVGNCRRGVRPRRWP